MTVDRALRTGRSAAGAATGLAVGAGRAWLRTVAWGTRAWVSLGTRVTAAAVDPESARRLVDDVRYGVDHARSGLRDRARDFLGVGDRGERASAASQRDEDGQRNGPISDRVLRGRGAELLRESADVTADDASHPAYFRILEELAPDEARILRLLAAEGPQPVVDVRAANLVGVASDVVATALNMLGPEAGCRHRDRVPAYLNNLERLELVEFSDRPLEDPSRYQVLEAQPEVLGTLKDTPRAKSIHRTVRLTPFGKDFCDVCLPLDAAEVEATLRENES
jgi:hypothetical protein